MKNYTFKVKMIVHNVDTDVHETILSIHMPLEAFFESVKQTPYLKDFLKNNPTSIITCSDYYYYDSNNNKIYNDKDLYFCDLKTFVNASSLKSVLIDDCCAGTLQEYPYPIDNNDVNDPADGLFDDVCEVIN